jgi:hypothetical protein
MNGGLAPSPRNRNQKMSTANPHDVRQFPRQVHLDFHTSPLIPDVAADFDADRFADVFATAGVQSVTVFAKCHHGMCYYPTHVGVRHPHLRRPDLLGEMIEALHRRGIRAPIYTTVAWEEDVATRFPAWRQMRANGTFAQLGTGPDGQTVQPGRWRFNDFLHGGYQEYIEAHVRELLDRYPVDGLFFDILFYERDGIYSDASVAFRKKHGLKGDSEQDFVRFLTGAQLQFAERFTPLIRDKHPRATVFYNMPNVLQVDASLGAAAMRPWRSHWEIESLPSGFWGYYHFPRLARRAVADAQPWLGQTGRFQKMWGDFGGIKPQPALEFECFRTQALGGGNSVGDQLHPRGTLDPGVYRLIGAVYAQCAAAQLFYADTGPVPQVGIFPAAGVDAEGAAAELSLEGAVQMCEESHYDAVVLDDGCDLDGLDVLILPDSTTVTERLAPKLRDFLARGGRLIASHRGGFDAAGKWSLPQHVPLTFEGTVDTTPTYWRSRADFLPMWAGSDRVVYQPGSAVRGGPGTRVLVDRVPPYFRRRTDLEYSSHFQAPPSPTVDADHPAVLAGDNWVYFADPIFREYRQSGNGVVRDAWRAAMEQLVGPPPFGAGLPMTVLVYPRRAGRDLRLTLLHYVPLRKAVEIDVVEERMSFAGETLRLPEAARSVRIFGTGGALPRAADGSGFGLPIAKGRLLLEVPGFFRD